MWVKNQQKINRGYKSTRKCIYRTHQLERITALKWGGAPVELFLFLNNVFIAPLCVYKCNICNKPFFHYDTKRHTKTQHDTIGKICYKGCVNRCNTGGILCNRALIGGGGAEKYRFKKCGSVFKTRKILFSGKYRRKSYFEPSLALVLPCMPCMPSSSTIQRITPQCNKYACTLVLWLLVCPPV